MTTYISPGVYTVEQDLSAYVSNLANTIVGIVGTADSGPTNSPVLITTQNEFVTTYGQVNPAHYMGYAAMAYLEQGNMIWVNRVASTNAAYASSSFLLPVGYANYTGKWSLASYVASTGLATFTLSDFPTTPAAKSVVIFPSSTSLPGFDPTDYTNNAPAAGKMGVDLLSLCGTPSGAPSNYVSPIVGGVFNVATGAGKNTSTYITGVSTTTVNSVTYPQITVNAAAFSTTNSPITSYPVGSIGLNQVALPTVGTSLVTIGLYNSTSPITLVSAAYSDALYNKAIGGTFAVSDLEALFVLGSGTPPSSVEINIPLYDTLVEGNNAKNMTLLYTILSTLLSMVNLGSAPAGTNSAVVYNNCRVAITGSSLYGVGSILSSGKSAGFGSLAQSTVDSNGNILAVNLVSMAAGILGAFAYSGQTVVPPAVISSSDQIINGSFTTNFYRPTWDMEAAGTSFVPTVLKFTSLGESDASDTCLTLSMNVTDQTASAVQNYTLTIYQRVSSTSVPVTSYLLNNFSVIEQYSGTIESIQSQLITSSRNVRLKIDYTTVDVISTTTGLVENNGDNLSFNPIMFTSETNSGVSIGTQFTPVVTNSVTTGYQKILDAPLKGGSIGSPINAYDIVGDGVSTGLAVFANPEAIDINVLVAPGWSADPVVGTAMVEVCQNRGDAIAVLDTPFGLTVQGVINYRKNVANINSSYAAMYYPWVKIADSVNQKNIFVPPSGLIAAQYAYNDEVGAIYTAPAGINRGVLTTALSTERLLSQGDRDALCLANINPIHNEPGYGIYIKGQYTLQTASTALNRVNVRRLLLSLRKVVATASRSFEFEPGDMITALKLQQIVDTIMQAQLYAGAVQSYNIDVGPSVNTAAVLNNNQLAMKISLVPTKTAEVIIETFTIYPQTGIVAVTTQ